MMSLFNSALDIELRNVFCFSCCEHGKGIKSSRAFQCSLQCERDRKHILWLYSFW